MPHSVQPFCRPDRAPLRRKRPRFAISAPKHWLAALALAASTAALAEPPSGDEFLSGYATSVLERDLHWKRGSFQVEVRDGVATVTLPEKDQEKADAAQRALADVEGLQAVEVAVRPGPVARAKHRIAGNASTSRSATRSAPCSRTPSSRNSSSVSCA